MTLRAWRLVAFVLVTLVPARSHAHAFAERYDLPLPLGYYLAGAGLAVMLSFVVTGLLMRPGSITLRWRRRIASPQPSHGARGAIVMLFGVAIVAGFVGPQGEPLGNILPVCVWVVWWVGVTYVCALVGDVWPVINPVAIVAEWANMVARGHLFRGRAPLSEATAGWFAAFLYVVFVWAEIAWPSNAVPSRLATAILLYCVLTWAAMARFGIEPWITHADPFARFFSLVGRFAPIDLRTGWVRLYGHGLIAARPATSSEMVFIILALASVGFDGLRETPVWNQLASAAADALYRAGLLGLIGNVTAGAMVKMLGLFAFASLLFGAYALAARSDARLVVWSLIPIAIAYHLAHYLSYLLIQGQAIIPLLSDPFGRGWNLVQTRGFQPDLAIVSARFVWTIAVGTIVAGHVAAVVVAHAIALRAYGDRRTALRHQSAMLVLMVAYTMFSLWVLSQPIVAV